MQLTKAQLAAIAHIENYATQRIQDANAGMKNVLRMSDISVTELAEAIQSIQTHARVALHFHPDRLDHNINSAAADLLESGFYKNQFESKLSNGKLSPKRGGPRDQWENELFGGAFAAKEIALSERPKYGALNLMLHPDGPSPRFGSCFFILKPAVSQRCTFTYMDSYRNPPEKGTLNFFDDVMGALMNECFERHFALGTKNIMPPELVAHLQKQLSNPYLKTAKPYPARNLNHYIEAQIHGKIQLKNDVDILVADPSFRDTDMGELLHQLCEKHEIALQWHPGFKLHVNQVPTNFRGTTMPTVANRIAEDGWIDVHKIGLAAADLKRHPEHWKDMGSYEFCLQELKLLWHVLVQYGEAFS